jgi:transposase
LITSYEELYINFDSKSNDSFTFLSIIVGAIEKKILNEGDTLILDNASIHCSNYNSELIDYILSIHNIKIYFLPTFSPEYNPCELIFGFIKNKIYKHGIEQGSIKNKIIESLNFLTQQNIINFYNKCKTLNFGNYF